MKIQDRYEYEPSTDLLGRGGFARVYRARDTLLERPVALKIFNANAQHNYSVLSEIKKVIQLEHPNLLRYYDVILLEQANALGEKEQLQIGVMELANAGDLKDFARGNPGSPLLFKLLKDVLQGLEYLHGKGIIHRDIKAQNVLLLQQDGQLTAKISDFGISKDTGAGGQSSSMMVGTVEYMAPEQFAPAKYGIDGKVASNLDLWSFGIMVHELLTDTTPFGSRDGDTTVEQIMAQILATELPQDIDRLPEPYRSVVRKCLVTNARERIRRASELVGYFEGPTGTAPTVSAPDADTRGHPQGGPAAQAPQEAKDDATKAYPKGGPAAQAPRDAKDDATKVYPKEGGIGAATSADADATKVYGDKPRTTDPAEQGAHESPRRKGVPVAAIAGLVLLVSAGGWYVGEKRSKTDAADQSVSGVGAASAEHSVIKIGSVAPLTGGIAHLGKDNENGVRLAVDEANAAGMRIAGKPVKFELVSADDQADPKVGITVAQKLVDAKVAGIVGHLNSGTTIPASAIYSQANIPMISGSATNPALTERGLKGVFRVVGRDDRQGPAVANYLLASNKPKTVAIIDDATAYGESLANEVEKTLKAAGVTVLPREKGTHMTVQWKAALSRIKGKSPDAVFYGGMDSAAGPLLKQARDLGMTAVFSFGDGACTNRMAELAGRAAEGLICSQAGIPVDVAGKKFLDAYKAKFNAEPILYSPFTYDAANLLIAAMKKADSPDPAKYLPALAASDFNGTSGNIKFDEKGDRKDAEMTIFTLKDGKIIPHAIIRGSKSLRLDEYAASTRAAPTK
jgi:branched-chain amino acid transport system substrate-binding protein